MKALIAQGDFPTIIAVLLNRLGRNTVVITEADIAKLERDRDRVFVDPTNPKVCVVSLVRSE